MKEKEQNEKKSEKRLRDKPLFKVIDLLINVLGAIIPVVVIIISTLAKLSFAELRNKGSLYAAIAISFSVLLLGMIQLVRFLRSKSAKATALKKQLIQVYSDALERSSINPNERGQYE